MNANFVFGIGNPLIDITFTVADEDLTSLGINKGTMELVDEKRQKEIFDYFQLTLIYEKGNKYYIFSKTH